jgi:transcription antitermination factor NusG
MVGKINAGPDADGDYTVTFDEDDGEEWTYAKPDEMEKAEKPQPDIKFSEGETVKITGPSAYNNSSYIGYAGTITSVSDDGKFAGVRINGDDEDTILTYEVTNLSKSATDEIDNLTWEPEPEVSSPAASKFEVNDRVEVVSEFPSLIGMKGKITQVSPNYGFVSVWLDGNSSASSFPVTAIKKIDEPQQTEEFHLGDMVEVTNPELSSFGQKGKITDMDVSVLVIQDSSGEVFFTKKSSVKKIG